MNLPNHLFNCEDRWDLKFSLAALIFLLNNSRFYRLHRAFLFRLIWLLHCKLCDISLLLFQYLFSLGSCAQINFCSCRNLNRLKSAVDDLAFKLEVQLIFQIVEYQIHLWPILPINLIGLTLIVSFHHMQVNFKRQFPSHFVVICLEDLPFLLG